ncbi:MAG TPA: Cache 3/Cache 2 fusion domain-containing protein [Methanospirillum sp.]|nr:Cache 3/Cache 2 fusion domain-containing protein [Methanospirillum sp.]
MRHASIGRKISVICLILVIVPILVLGIVAYSSAQQAVHDSIQHTLEGQVNDMQEASKTVYTLTQNKVNSDLNVLRKNFNEKGTPEIIDDKLILTSGSGRYTINDNNEVVDSVQDLLGGAATIFQKRGDQAIRISTNIIGADGKRVIGTPVSQTVYDAVINRGETYYGTANVVGKQYITAYEPIKDKNGKVIGILFVGVDEAATVGILKDQIKQKKIGEKGYMYVLNSTGTALIHPSIEGENVSEYPFVQEILAKKTGYITYTWNGVEKVAAFAYYPQFDWFIVASGSLSDFTGPLDTIRNTIIIVMIAGILGGIALSYWFGRIITRRMQELLDLSHRVTAGDLTGTIHDTSSEDEIGMLGRGFAEVIDTFERFRDEIRTISSAAASGRLDIRGDPGKFQGDYASIIEGVNETVDAMAAPIKEAIRLSSEYASGNFTDRVSCDLQVSGEFVAFCEAMNKIGADISTAIQEVQNQMDELAADVTQVSDNVDSVTSGVNQAKRSIGDVAEGTGQVAEIAAAVNMLSERSSDSINQILVAMKDLSSTVSEVASKMEDAAIITNDTEELSARGKDVATRAEVGMHGILTSSSEIEHMITDISDQMGEIGRIVDIISSIADQTNLLALNAAIEAARAGDAGLGFAVVAGEVKELATESQRSAENIAGIINTLQKKTGAITTAVKVSLTEVRTGNEAVSETLTIFGEIVSAIHSINQNMNEVAAASEEQAASVEEVTSTVNEFGAMIQQTTKESIGLAAASEESSAAVDQIVTMVDQVNESMTHIRQAVTDARESVRLIETEMNVFKI